MSTNIIIGNILSVGAAVFTILSSMSHGKRKIYGYQGIQCLILAVANIFFFSFAGVTTYILCGIRNLLIAGDKYNKYTFAAFLVLIPAIGIYINNRGIVGYIPVVITIIYMIGQYVLEQDMKIKGLITFNLVCWAVYEILILDIVSFVMDMISAVATVIAMVRDHRAERK